MVTIKNADAALKDYYLDAFTAELNDHISPFFSAIEKNTECVSGKDVKLSIVRNNRGGIVSGSEDADLPTPYKNRYINITLPLKNIYGTIEISDKAMRASRESAGAFVNLVNAEMDGLISSAKENFRRMLFGDGTGILCTIKSKSSSTLFKVDHVKAYYIGMEIDITNTQGDVIAGGSGYYITEVDVKNRTIVINPGITESFTTGYVCAHGSRDKEILGLNTLFCGRKLYGVERTEEPYFIPYEVDTNGTLTLKKIIDIIDYMEEFRDSKINMILCSYKTRNMIAELADSSRRIVNTIDVNTGYGTVTVNNVPVYAEKYCNDNAMYFLNTDDFALYQLCDWEWLEDEDGKILKQIPGKAAYSATLVKYAELVCRKPFGQAILLDFDSDFM